ncbi:MAG: RidA family protein [candidate division Zixibacteria bacterium]|nr:RidA family protein [candidate division Zixibacteria bacterium]
MNRINVSSTSPYEKMVGFSRAVRIGNLICVAGTGPVGDDGETVGKTDAYAQAKRCLEIIRRSIEEAGGKIEDVFRTRIYVTDMERWEDISRAHGEMFADIRPACTLVEVSRLVRPEWYVEIEADCFLSEQK